LSLTGKNDKTVSKNLKPFKKGQSGNPSGRPKTPDWFKEHTPEAMAKILSLLNSDDDKVALQSATLILAYSLGRPTEHVQVTDVTDRAEILRSRRAKRAA